MTKQLCAICFFLFVTSNSFVLSQESYFPREGEKKSEYYDGPYIYYQNSKALIINSVGENDEMLLSVKEEDYKNLDFLNVYKPGFMPREFAVKIKKNFLVEPDEYKNVEKLFVLSDIEGNFNSFVNLLQQHNVLDENLKWKFGSGHLVIIGDVFDRGVHQTELLWLIYKLEEEAKESGGNVHFILGNHEVMNFQNDLRYVEKKYTVLDSLVSLRLNLRYCDLIGVNSELGQWLRSKNAIVKIDNKIFVHAGISPKLAKTDLSISEINDILRKCIDKDKNEYNFTDSLILKRNGPLWYRGYFNEEGYESASDEDVKMILEKYNSEFIFVGHTRFEKPQSFFEGKIRAINVNPIQDHQYVIPARKSYGILIINNNFFIADENGSLENY